MRIAIIPADGHWALSARHCSWVLYMDKFIQSSPRLIRCVLRGNRDRKRVTTLQKKKNIYIYIYIYILYYITKYILYKIYIYTLQHIYIYICCYRGYIFDNCSVVWWGCKESWVCILALTWAISDGFLIHLSLPILIYTLGAATRTSWGLRLK